MKSFSFECIEVFWSAMSPLDFAFTNFIGFSTSAIGSPSESMLLSSFPPQASSDDVATLAFLVLVGDEELRKMLFLFFRGD